MLRKPDSLEALHPQCEKVFRLLQTNFKIQRRVMIDLSDIDAAADSLSDHYMLVAMTMRRLQALRHISDPTRMTQVGVVVSSIAELFQQLAAIENHGLTRSRGQEELVNFRHQMAQAFHDVKSLEEEDESSRADVVLVGTTYPVAPRPST